MQVLPRVSAILLPLFSSMGFAPEAIPEIKPCPPNALFEWGVHLQGKTPDLSEKPDSIDSWAIEHGFLNFSLSDEWHLNWLQGEWEWPVPQVEGILRDSAVAMHLREPRKGLRLFFRRLEFLPEADSKAAGKAKLMGAEKSILCQQLAFVSELQDRSSPWPPQLLGAALETFRAALVQFWENESLDVEGEPERTCLRTMLWASQRSFLASLLPTLAP